LAQVRAAPRQIQVFGTVVLFPEAYTYWLQTTHLAAAPVPTITASEFKQTHPTLFCQINWSLWQEHETESNFLRAYNLESQSLQDGTFVEETNTTLFAVLQTQATNP